MTKKTKVALLFGGASNEYEVSLRSAYAVYCHLPSDCTPILIGITKDGDWLHYKGAPALIEKDGWQKDGSKLSRIHITLAPHGALHTDAGEDVTPDLFLPILHGQTCEDGRLQGLFDLIGIPYVGCGCAASVLTGHLLPAMEDGRYNRILFCPTGALLSPTSTQQGESIPCVCHAVAIEM